MVTMYLAGIGNTSILGKSQGQSLSWYAVSAVVFSVETTELHKIANEHYAGTMPRSDSQAKITGLIR